MERTYRFSKIALAIAWAGVAATAVAAGSVYAQSQSPASGTAIEFRDPRTGKVWTPYNVGQDDKPATAPSTSLQDKAFDPRTQHAVVEGVTVQRPRAQVMGVLPVTAGPSVPLVTIDGASLQAVPGERWITALYVTNNSGDPVNAVIGCLFTNGDRKVEDTRVIMPPAGPGERLAVQVVGPRVDMFVDRVNCQIITPI